MRSSSYQVLSSRLQQLIQLKTSNHLSLFYVVYVHHPTFYVHVQGQNGTLGKRMRHFIEVLMGKGCR